jgi:uncharacterized membrane protein YfcA
MTAEFFVLLAVGFCAQLVDGALGMAYGVLTNSALLMLGLPAAHASALVHTAEVFTTGASAASHIYHRNVDWRFVMRLGIAGVLGAVLGAWILSNLDLVAARRWVYLYLLVMGCYILLKSFRIAPQRSDPAKWLPPVGFAGGFLDASGGGGWGPVTTSTLMAASRMQPRTIIGTVSGSEFIVSIAASAGFLLALGTAGIDPGIVAMMLLGGAVAAPLSAWLVSRMNDQVLGTGVGGLIIFLNVDRVLSLFGVSPSVGLGIRVVVALAAVLVIGWLFLRNRSRSAAAAGSRRAWTSSP